MQNDNLAPEAKSPNLQVESLVKGLMAEITEDYSVEVRMSLDGYCRRNAAVVISWGWLSGLLCLTRLLLR